MPDSSDDRAVGYVHGLSHEEWTAADWLHVAGGYYAGHEIREWLNACVVYVTNGQFALALEGLQTAMAASRIVRPNYDDNYDAFLWRCRIARRLIREQRDAEDAA